MYNPHKELHEMQLICLGKQCSCILIMQEKRVTPHQHMLAMTKGANKIKQLSDAKHAILRQKYRRPDVFFLALSGETMPNEELNRKNRRNLRRSRCRTNLKCSRYHTCPDSLQQCQFRKMCKKNFQVDPRLPQSKHRLQHERCMGLHNIWRLDYMFVLSSKLDILLFMWQIGHRVRLHMTTVCEWTE